MSRVSRPPQPPTADPIPDRPLEPPAQWPSVAIRSAGNHPFVYKKMIAGPTGTPWPKAGDLVRVVDRGGFPVGYGLWNPKSQIALRILSHGMEPPGREMWAERVENAVNLRRDVLKLDAETNAYRVLHAEADGLSGLIVDRFDDVLSAEAFSLGMYQRSGPDLEPDRGQARDDPGPAPRRRADRACRRFSRPSRRDPGVAPEKSRSTSTASATGSASRAATRPASSAISATIAANSPNSARIAPVLDLCCYTAGFTLNALVRGEAREVTGVDLDEKAIAVAKENANLNQVRPSFVHADAFGYVRQMGSNSRSFGVRRPRPSQAHPRPARRRRGEAEILRPELPRPADRRGKRPVIDLLLLRAPLFRGIPHPSPRRRPQGGPGRAGPGRHRRGGRPSDRPGGAGRGIFEGGVAVGGREAGDDRGGPRRGRRGGRSPLRR